MNFILDGLHKELNRVLDKPYTEAVESKGRKDSILDLEF
jgi:ubiquitin carboxyl-terminal hydrolase 19